jgi:hypothetical protein
MGHNIEDRNTHRYDYSNADIQEELYLIMERRPLLAYEAEKNLPNAKHRIPPKRFLAHRNTSFPEKAVKQ